MEPRAGHRDASGAVLLSLVFSAFTRKRKAIIRFFKERQPDVLRDLTGQGFGAIAQLIIKGTFP